MGLGMGIGQLLIILLIVALIFGTKRLKSIGGDLGGALKGFRTAMESGEDKQRKEDERRRLENSEADAEFAEQKDKSGHV
ncbi:MAG TPA: twin-arginine translocase TatA/TatE family subunit [Gammaproteobacteria bacterium]|nr:twin-arginine translocase TatA/TatE family subunit [Gammaproteobacteria bacterium]